MSARLWNQLQESRPHPKQINAARHLQYLSVNSPDLFYLYLLTLTLTLTIRVN